MNTEEKYKQLELLASDCVTAGDVMEKVQSLTDSDKYSLVYRIAVDEMFESIRQHALDFSHLLDELGLVNDYEKRVSKTASTMGMTELGLAMINQVFSKQARMEMQAQDEQTQWGMQLSAAISDQAADIHSQLRDLTTLVCNYEAVLLGRRMGVNFTDKDGTFEPMEKRDNTD